MDLARADTALVNEQVLRTGTPITGTLEPREQATITAQLGGALRDVRVELGQAVRRDQLLAKIDPAGLGDAARSAEAGVRAAEASLALAQEQAKRSEGLVRSGALAQTQLDQDQNQVRTARANLLQARAQRASASHALSETSIRSPLQGVVSVQAVYEGDVVSPGAQLFTIIDPSSLRLQASVPARALGELKVGSVVEFRVHGQDERVQGQITRIAPAADPVTGQISLLVSIPNDDGRARSGLFAEGRVVTQTHKALAVPLTALDLTTDPPQVTRIHSGKAERVAVQTGVTDEAAGLVELRSGVSAGDRVVLGPERNLEPGTRVSLRGPERKEAVSAGEDSAQASAAADSRTP